jgi:hypothetical protein
MSNGIPNHCGSFDILIYIVSDFHFDLPEAVFLDKFRRVMSIRIRRCNEKITVEFSLFPIVAAPKVSQRSVQRFPFDVYQCDLNAA